jgi:hypothetical protein
MKKLSIFFILFFFSITVNALTPDTIRYTGKMPEGLAGNGQVVVRVRHDGFAYHSGGNARGTFTVLQNGIPVVFDSIHSGAEFFPGGVQYFQSTHGLTLEVLHGSIPGTPYFICLRFTGNVNGLSVSLKQTGSPEITPAGLIPVKSRGRSAEVIFYTGNKPQMNYDALRKTLERSYASGFRVHSGSSLIDRTIPFNRYLLNLGFDGKLHVCEIFRWRDVWSRDLGSGLVPGALATGEFAQARTTIEYDLKRHASHNPASLKITDDPSQGGTAEGVAWLTDAVWQYYLNTGDKKFLTDAEQILLPWVRMWIKRDYKNEGLLVDVSEWMDHSRYLELPDGSRILYSNALFVKLLDIFSRIESECGKPEICKELNEVGSRFVTGINTKLWNEKNGIYDNLSLWEGRDERSSSAENMLAIDCGAAPKEKIRRILDAVAKNNWRSAGSTTIYPPMTVVDTTIDHNYKMWPWWNAFEASVRLRNGDINGGIHLLECCAKTLEDEHFPGLMEELTTPYGVTEGGNAFLTAAGSYLDAIKKGLLGFEILEPACSRVRVTPHMPDSWKDWNAEIPLYQGAITLTQNNGHLEISVNDPRVKVVETKAGVSVSGAKQIIINNDEHVQPFKQTTLSPVEYPPIPERKAYVFYDSTFMKTPMDDIAGAWISIDGLAKIDTASTAALIIPGNALPLKLKDGSDTRAVLSRFMDKGNALVFYGATMHDRGIVGETGGVIDWYDYRPALSHTPINGWLFKTGFDSAQVPKQQETGYVNRWFEAHLRDNDWEPIRVPQLWEEHFKRDYDGWGWYRAHFTLSANAKGKAIYINLGMIDDDDWTYINGHLLGAKEGWQEIRRYAIRPGDSLYTALNFGGDNVIAIQVLDNGGGGGLYKDSTMLEIESGSLAWQPVDINTGLTLAYPERSGVLYAGNGDYFNSWETSRGAFGFSIDGEGVEFEEPLSNLKPLNIPVHEAFTDFAIAKPLLFQPLAFTKTNKHLLIPDTGERYPCIARIHNSATHSDIFLIPESVRKAIKTKEVLRLIKF